MPPKGWKKPQTQAEPSLAQRVFAADGAGAPSAPVPTVIGPDPIPEPVQVVSGYVGTQSGRIDQRYADKAVAEFSAKPTRAVDEDAVVFHGVGTWLFGKTKYTFNPQTKFQCRVTGADAIAYFRGKGFVEA